MSTDAAIRRLVPTPDQFAWMFGGCEPVMRVRPGDILDLSHEDAFGGQDPLEQPTCPALPSSIHSSIRRQARSMSRAEPGDTLAIHLIAVKPARDWAVSTTVPLFGALTGTKSRSTLQPPLPERTWVYRVDVAQAGRHLPGPRFRLTDPSALTHSWVRSASPPRPGEARNVLVPEAFGGNMDTPEARAGTTIYLDWKSPGARCPRSATVMTTQPTARQLLPAPPSRALWIPSSRSISSRACSATGRASRTMN